MSLNSKTGKMLAHFPVCSNDLKICMITIKSIQNYEKLPFFKVF